MISGLISPVQVKIEGQMSSQPSMITLTQKTGVGKAIHELALTDALNRSSKQLIPPGAGRSLIVVPEALIGRGRPDSLLVVLSPATLRAYINSGLQIETFTEAKALASMSVFGGADVMKLVNRGWSIPTIRRYSACIADSLAVEAKMKDWKQAIRQASRFRHLAHRAAVMLPKGTASERAEPYLSTYDLGLLEYTDERVEWGVPAPKRALSGGSALWLLELVARQSRP